LSVTRSATWTIRERHAIPIVLALPCTMPLFDRFLADAQAAGARRRRKQRRAVPSTVHLDCVRARCRACARNVPQCLDEAGRLGDAVRRSATTRSRASFSECAACRRSAASALHPVVARVQLPRHVLELEADGREVLAASVFVESRG
jgi:hypothetical protein